MEISTRKLMSVLTLFGLSNIVYAQAPPTQGEIDQYVAGMASDFNQYMDNYMDPFLQGLGYGFNNGWYNTARPHKSLGFDLTISANLALVPTASQSFKFIPENYKVLDLADANSDVLPTVMGGKTTTEIRSVFDKTDPNSPYVTFPVLDGIKDDLPTKLVAVPSPIVQIGVGIVKGTELKVRWIPTVSGIDGLDYNYWGLGVMHSISQWIPVVKDLPFLDISGFIGYTNVGLSYTLPEGTIDGSDQMAEFGVKTFNYQLVASAKASVITGFIGIGYDNFKTNLAMKGTYDFEVPGTGQTSQLENPVDLDAKGGGFRATVGARLKIAILTLHGSYTLQGYNTINAGIGFSFR
ncbi:MAG: hypothetical protein KDC79_04440 [Cyclobacteriaceae bacterium]|nr:hypothetical protein [Cyclobacteriaceae bacterium]